MGNIVIVIIIGIIILTVIGCAVKASAKYDGKAILREGCKELIATMPRMAEVMLLLDEEQQKYLRCLIGKYKEKELLPIEEEILFRYGMDYLAFFHNSVGGREAQLLLITHAIKAGVVNGRLKELYEKSQVE